MGLSSYDKIRRGNFIKSAVEYGGMLLVIVLMSLLGFAAYFNGIGMKIGMKSYQISVLRAVGTSISQIRKRIFWGNLKLPVISGAFAYAFIKIVQKLSERGYEKLTALYTPNLDGSISINEETAIYARELSLKYFLDNKIWVVPIEKPFLIITSLMCVITMIITLIAFRKFKGDISYTLNSGRERQ